MDRRFGRPGCPGWLDTADLTIGHLERGDRDARRLPFLRDGSHGGFRPQPDGLIQIDGHATGVGATAIFELASWLCPSLLKRPPDSGSGSRYLAARSKAAGEVCVPRRLWRSCCQAFRPAAPRSTVGESDRRSTVVAGDGFDQRPAHDRRSLFGDLPAVDFVSDSLSLGVNPAPEQRCMAQGNRWTSPISATRIAAVIGPIPHNPWITR